MKTKLKSQIVNFIKKICDKELIISVSSTILGMAVALVQNKLIVVGFSKAEYGSWSLLLTVYTLLEMMPFSSLFHGTYRYSFSYAKQKNNYIFTVYKFYGLIFIVQSAICAFVNILFPSVFGSTRLMVFFLLYTITEIFKNESININNGARDRGYVFLGRTVEFAVTITILWLLIRMEAMCKETLCIALMFRNAIVILSMIRKRERINNGSIFLSQIREIVLYSIPLLGVNIFLYIQNVINKWYLNGFLSDEMVAMYTVIIGVSYYPPNAYLGIANNYFLPVVYSKEGKIGLRKYLQYITVFSVPLFLYCGLVPLIGKVLILLLYDERYLDALPYVGVSSFFICVYSVASFATFVLRRDNSNNKFVGAQIVTSLSMLIIGYFLIKSIGLKGAMINYCIGQLLWSILMMVVCFRHLMNGYKMQEVKGKKYDR